MIINNIRLVLVCLYGDILLFACCIQSEPLSFWLSAKIAFCLPQNEQNDSNS